MKARNQLAGGMGIGASQSMAQLQTLPGVGGDGLARGGQLSQRGNQAQPTGGAGMGGG